MRPPSTCQVVVLSTVWLRLGDGSVGILLTSKQYEKKFYTQREAAVAGTTFSAVSITFSLVVIAQVELEHLFLPFYAAICLAGIVAAVIIPRLPPLSMKKDTFIDGSKPHKDADAIPAGHSTFSWGLELAVNKASQVKSAKSVFGEGVRNAVDMVFGVLPVVMGAWYYGFGYCGIHFSVLIPRSTFHSIPRATWCTLEAVAAFETIVASFMDMFIPAILAASIDNEMTSALWLQRCR